MGAIQRLEQRVINIERMVASMFKQLRRENQNAGYDIEAGRMNTANAQAGVDANAKSIAETQDAMCEMSVNTEQSVTDLENAMCETGMETDARITDMENAMCESSSDMEARMADIENAICELSMANESTN
ncbi:MAG: hypothetical protein J6J86_00680 [Lachnospiraceae bacterium]|nr:hypothetical protein [Lachnospiraceae bacterium]